MDRNEELQKDEVELLKSMYNEEELIFGCCESSVDFQMKLNLDDQEGAIELAVQLPAKYPTCARPQVIVRSARLRESEVNRDLRNFMENLPFGEAILHELIGWLQENAPSYYVLDVELSAAEDKNADVMYRMWIFSHHLYSSTKRRDILALTKRHDLRGISVPGKPAIIVVEGWKKECQAFWEQVRGWSWQRIHVKLEEDLAEPSSLGKFRELILQSANGKSGDLGQLKVFLEEHRLGGYFRQMFDLC